MFSRKQFLNELLIRGVQSLASFGEASEEGQASDFFMFTELSPSLLKIEAERLGIDPACFDEAGLRRKVYAALCQECRRKSDLSL
jgi:hypothetical protein